MKKQSLDEMENDVSLAQKTYKEYFKFYKQYAFIQNEVKKRFNLNLNQVLNYFDGKADIEGINEDIEKEIIKESEEYDYLVQYIPKISKEKEINELEKNANKRDLENLEYIKNNILAKNDAHTNELSNEAEFFGNQFARVYSKTLNDAKSSSTYNKTHPEFLSNITYDLDNRFNPVEFGIKNIDDIQKMELKLSKEYSEKLIDCLKDIDEILPKDFEKNGNINENKNIDTYLSKIHDEIEKSIDDKDLNKINTLVESHKALREKIHGLREKVSNLSKSTFIPPNASSSRIDKLPFDDRFDYVNGSKINTLCHMVNFARLTNTPIEEVVKSPLKAIKEGYKKYADNYMKDIVDDDMFKTVENIFNIDDTKSAVVASKLGNFQTVVSRLLESLPMSDDGLTKDEINKNLVKCDLYQKICISPIKTNTIVPFELDDEKKSKLIENLLIVNPKDRDLVKLSNSPKIRNEETLSGFQQGYKFDPLEYVKNNINEMDLTLKVLDYERAFEYYKGMVDNADEILKSYAQNLLYCVKKADSNSKYQDLEKFIDNPTKYINSDSYKKCVAYQKLDKCLKSDNVDTKEALDSISEMEKIRKNRFFLARWFTSSGKKDRAQINELKEKLATKLNISKDDISNYIKADINKDENSKDKIVSLARENNKDLSKDVVKVISVNEAKDENEKEVIVNDFVVINEKDLKKEANEIIK